MPSEPKTQDPADKLDYFIDWEASPNGLAAGETITTSTWTPYDDQWQPTTDLIPDEGKHSNSDTTATGWVSIAPGVSNVRRYFTNHIVTNQGRELSWSITINVKEQ
jgi:hypothetical protein